MIDVNLKGPIFGRILIKDYFKKIGGGQIINISSIASYLPWDLFQFIRQRKRVYVDSRTYVKSFEHAKIRANAILPGFINTPINDPLPKPLLDMMVKTTGIESWNPNRSFLL